MRNTQRKQVFFIAALACAACSGGFVQTQEEVFEQPDEG